MAPDLHISRRLHAVLPPLTDEQRQGLEQAILADGRVTDPILYWFDGARNVVIDGMHRWEIIRKHGITEYHAEELQTAGNSYEEVEEWIWRRQASRRNMTREQIGEWYNILKQTRGGDHKTKRSIDLLIDASEKIAQTAGVSPKTVRRAGARVEAIEALTKPAQHIAKKATDKEVKALSTLSEDAQAVVARAVRVGQAASVTEAINLTGVKAEPCTQSNGSGGDLAAKNKALAHAYRDKLARAIGDYHNVMPNRKEHDRLVKLVQSIVLWD